VKTGPHDSVSGFDMILACDRQTDRQTDGQTKIAIVANSPLALCIANYADAL